MGTTWAIYLQNTGHSVLKFKCHAYNTELTFKENSVTYLKVVVLSPFRPQKAINLDTKYQFSSH